jgi:hypothetical protein
VAAVVTVAAAGCGSGASGQHHAASVAPKAGSAGALPSGWRTARLASGATLPYPPGWSEIHSDPGTVSAVVYGAGGTIRAYLNATPATPNEHFAGWARFRVHHDAEEGDRHVKLISTQTNVPVGAQRGSCVVDQYMTSVTSYRELACLLSPGNGGTRIVLVAAAQPNAWASEQSTFKFALDHYSS